MMISTRGRYALHVLIDLAEHSGDGYIPMKDVAKRQNLSLKYIEQTVPVLTKNGLLTGIRGKGGGYKLSRLPEEYKIGEILRLTEGDLAPVKCVSANSEPCNATASCRIYTMWSRFNEMTNEYFDSITLDKLL